MSSLEECSLMRGEPPKLEFITNCVFILTCLNSSHLQSTLHLMQCTYGDIFSTSQNSFRSHRFWCVFMFLPFFGFTCSTLAKHFPMRTFFILGNKEKSPGRRSGESVGRSMRVMMFLVKNCWTLSEVWAGELVNQPSWNGQTCCNSLQEKFTEA